MNDRQQHVVNALARVFGSDNLVVNPDESRGLVHIMAQDEGVTVLSVDVPQAPDPDHVDAGDRVQFMRGNDPHYGLIVIYRDGNDTIGIVPDGEPEVVWDYVKNVEIVANGD